MGRHLALSRRQAREASRSTTRVRRHAGGGPELLRAVPEPRAMLLRQVLVAVLASTASAFVVSPRPTAPTLSAVAEVRTAAPQMFLG